MLSLKRGNDEDVDSLIESMLRLIEYMNQNPTFKRDIFKSFSAEDLNKILKNMEDSNTKLRKVSSLFLCSILTNTDNCDKFCTILDLLPVAGKLSVTPIPERMVKILTSKPKLLQVLNHAPLTISPQGENPFCWHFSVQMAKEGVQYANCFYQSQLKDIKNFFYEFADPAESLIGVVYTPQRTILSTLTNPLQGFQLSQRDQGNLSPSDQSIRKSVETYRPNSAVVPQASPIKSRYGPIQTEQLRKTHGASHSPVIRQSTSPQQHQLTSQLATKQKQSITQKSQSSTPVSSYTTFLNAQRLKIENNRYTSDKQKSIPPKTNNFDFLRHRLSDNISHVQKSSTVVSSSQNSQSKVKSNAQSNVQNSSFTVNSPGQASNVYYKKQTGPPSMTPTEQRPVQDWRSIAMSANQNYGFDWRSNRAPSSSKKNVVKIRLN